MVYGAIDLHMRYSQVRIITAEGRVIREGRVATTAERLVSVFAPHGPMRILLESGTESEWVAQALEGAGHTAVVADPNFAPMYGEVRRAVKTDGRDVAALAEANRRGWYRPAHRASVEQRARRQVLCARRQLVQMRSGTISVMRALRRQSGYRAGTGGSAACVRALLAAGADPHLITASGKTARDLARIMGWPRVVELLRDAEAVARS